MKLTITFSERAAETIAALKLPGESREACVERLISNLAPIAYDRDNYEQHFGKQQRMLGSANERRRQETRTVALKLSADMQRVIRTLATVGRDNNKRELSYRIDGKRTSASICTYADLADNYSFEKVKIPTMRALERRGLIKIVSTIGRRGNYTQRYALTSLGQQVAK